MLLDDCYISYINLDHRTDRQFHMLKELSRVKINATRFPAIQTSANNYDVKAFNPAKVNKMLLRTPGAIGCHYSQVAVMERAYAESLHAFVMEDDLIFCSDLPERIAIIDPFLATHEWDVLWLGGTFHINPPVWHKKARSIYSALTNIYPIGRDVECTDNPRIVRTYGAFSTFAYIVNWQSIPKILKLLEDNVADSIGIDYLFIQIQPQLKTYAFVPGCVKQMDNKSDIGNGMTIFSGFSKLGPYWFQDRMEDFDPLTFNWGEAKQHE